MAATVATKLRFGVGDVMDGSWLSPLGGASATPVVEGGQACSLAAAAVQGPPDPLSPVLQFGGARHEAWWLRNLFYLSYLLCGHGRGLEFDACFKLSSTAVGFGLVDFETLILMERKSCVHFTMYTMVETLSGGGFFG
jgi:hypothetical protein